MGFLRGLLVGVAVAGVVPVSVSVADPVSPPRPSAGRVSCGVLDKLQESYDNDIEAGLGGLRIVWGQWGNRLANSRDKVQIFSHGVRYLKQIDSEANVPGLAPVVSRLQDSSEDLQDSMDSLTQRGWGGWGWGSYGGYDTLRNPAEGDWAALDNADDQAQALEDLITDLRARGCA